MSEPNLYDTEFFTDEATLEGDVEMDFGLGVGRRSPLGSLWQGLYCFPNWWRTAVFDPHHSDNDRFEVFEEMTTV